MRVALLLKNSITLLAAPVLPRSGANSPNFLLGLMFFDPPVERDGDTNSGATLVGSVFERLSLGEIGSSVGAAGKAMSTV